MTKSNREFEMYLVSDDSLIDPTDTGNRLVRGRQVLGQFVKERLGQLTPESKDRMRALIESSPEHLDEMFRGLPAIRIYSESDIRSRISIRQIKFSITD